MEGYLRYSQSQVSAFLPQKTPKRQPFNRDSNLLGPELPPIAACRALN